MKKKISIVKVTESQRKLRDELNELIFEWAVKIWMNSYELSPRTLHTRLWFDKITFLSQKWEIFFLSTSFSLNSFDVIELSWGSRKFAAAEQVEIWAIRRKFQDLCNGKLSPMHHRQAQFSSWLDSEELSIFYQESRRRGNFKFSLSWVVVCLHSTQQLRKNDCIAQLSVSCTIFYSAKKKKWARKCSQENRKLIVSRKCNWEWLDNDCRFCAIVWENIRKIFNFLQRLWFWCSVNTLFIHN